MILVSKLYVYLQIAQTKRFVPIAPFYFVRRRLTLTLFSLTSISRPVIAYSKKQTKQNKTFYNLFISSCKTPASVSSFKNTRFFFFQFFPVILHSHIYKCPAVYFVSYFTNAKVCINTVFKDFWQGCVIIFQTFFSFLTYTHAHTLTQLVIWSTIWGFVSIAPPI